MDIRLNQYIRAAANPYSDINHKLLTIRGCWGSDYSHFHRAIELLRTPGAQSKWSTLKLDPFPLSAANEALSAVAESRTIKALIAP